MANDEQKSGGQFARVLVKPCIGLIGLLIVRSIVDNLPMVKEAGWIIPQKLTVQAGMTMTLDAMVLFVLVMFALELHRYLSARVPEMPGFATIMADLVFLISAGLAYVDFKPLLRALPLSKQTYTWTFLVLAAIPLVQMIVMLYQNIDRMTTVFLRKVLHTT